ncbi:hypothetical protein GQ457_12G021820 [Hibiscus cannabinus]
MSGRRPRPMMGKLSELLVSGKRAGFISDAATSPTSPLDVKTPSPRGMKRYDAGGVGLGIVAALDKSTTGSCKHAVCSSNLIVVGPGKNFDGFKDNLEEITYVISHGSGKSSTKVYYDGGEDGHGARFVEDVGFPTSDFLSSCHLCRKHLHGRDIYMYRGEKGFCSSECRATLIMVDERKERCRSEVSRSAKLSTSYNSGEIFFSAGILAI